MRPLRVQVAVVSAASVFLAACLAGCGMASSPPPLFELRSPDETGIRFANTLTEDDSVYNALRFDYMYNGGGVAVGDVNNDGRPDVFFAGNMVSSRLYLNRGKLRFDDVTERAGVATHVWAAGVTMADVDQDGRLDIYVSVCGPATGPQRANLLFINQGPGADGTPRFAERA